MWSRAAELGDIEAAGADRDDKFHFMVQVAGRRRVGHVGAARHQCVGRLGEEERRLARGIAAHLADVVGVVAADAEDAADGKQSPALDRNRDLGGRGNDERGHDGTFSRGG